MLSQIVSEVSKLGVRRYSLVDEIREIVKNHYDSIDKNSNICDITKSHIVQITQTTKLSRIDNIELRINVAYDKPLTHNQDIDMTSYLVMIVVDKFIPQKYSHLDWHFAKHNSRENVIQVVLPCTDSEFFSGEEQNWISLIIEVEKQS